MMLQFAHLQNYQKQQNESLTLQSHIQILR